MSSLGEKTPIYIVSEGVARARPSATRARRPLKTQNVAFTGLKLLRDLLGLGRNLTECNITYNVTLGGWQLRTMKHTGYQHTISQNVNFPIDRGCPPCV